MTRECGLSIKFIGRFVLQITCLRWEFIGKVNGSCIHDDSGDEVGVEGGGAREEGGGGGEVLLLLRIGDGDVEVVAGAESGGGGLDGLVVAVGIEGGEDCIGVRGRVKERVERGIRALRRRRTVVMVNGGAVVVVVEDQRVHYLVVLGGVENVMLLVVGIVIHHFGWSGYEGRELEIMVSKLGVWRKRRRRSES